MNTSTLPLHLIGTNFTDDEYDICDHGTNVAVALCHDCEQEVAGLLS